MRGVSPLIGALFLIIVSIAVAVLFFVWARGMFGSQSRFVQIMVKEASFIESRTRVAVQVTVRNAGSGKVTIVSVSLLKPNGEEIGELESEMGVVSLDAGSEATFTGFFDRRQFVKGETYVVKVTYSVDGILNSVLQDVKYG